MVNSGNGTLPTYSLKPVSKGPKTYTQLKSIECLTGLEVASVFNIEHHKLRISLSALIHKWRARLFILRDTGWRHAQGLNLSVMLCCPPAAAYTTTQGIHCKYTYICPFCWMRKTGSVFDRFNWAAFGHGYSQQDSIRDIDLVTLTRETYWPVAEVEIRGALVQYTQPTARQVWKDVGPVSLGMYSIATCEPASVADYVVVKERFLVATLPGQDLKSMVDEYDLSVRTLRADYLDRFTMAEAIGRALAYPDGLVLADPRITAKILNARTRARTATGPYKLDSYWGLLRDVNTYNFDKQSKQRMREVYGYTVDSVSTKAA